MNEALIHHWNSMVDPEDDIYHLGDFSLGLNEQGIQNILRRLNGTKYLVLGNHDDKIRKNPALFLDSHQNFFSGIYEGILEKKIGSKRIIMCHYAMRVWNRSHHGSYHLYGHSHGTLPDDPHARSFDVGVDPNGLFPINIEQVHLRMARKIFKPIDHHGERTP
jgi:calcineurin-like phosphoesterase family protein